MRKRHLLRTLLLVATLLAASLGAAQAESVSELEPFHSSPQIENIWQPLEGVPTSAEVRSAVFTLADPRETHLGRTSDIQLASLIRGFNANGYVLDRFALPWQPPKVTNPAGQGSARGGGGQLLPSLGTAEFFKRQRARPGVLVFRQDRWRSSRPTQDTSALSYFVVFLVGESPTFGIQPKAFTQALLCSANLNAWQRAAVSPRPQASCNQLPDLQKLETESNHPKGLDGPLKLQIIGPSFSGSISSLGEMLGELSIQLGKENVEFEVISPSATVLSNQEFTTNLLADVEAEGTSNETLAQVHYQTLATTLDRQFEQLCAYDKRTGKSSGPWFERRDRIAILAEESSFGQGVNFLRQHKVTNPAKGACRQDEWDAFVKRLRVAFFPQNVAAIRAEHFVRDKNQNQAVNALLPTQGPLLELDFSPIDQNIDRPPVYHKLLTSRSDELMLYGGFDALRHYVSPSMVVIVATDVRDRLFLLNEIRKQLPRSLPVMLEMDYLIAHPDYRKIARGSLIIPVSESLVCTDKENQDLLVPCFGNYRIDSLPQDDGAGQRETWVECPKGKCKRAQRQYVAFPSGYAANNFRAVFQALGSCQAGVATASGAQRLPSCVPDRAVDMVTTLAGFQGADLNGSRYIPQRLLAANSRSAIGRPAYSLLLVIGLILCAVAIWMYAFSSKYLITLSAFRYSNPLRGVREHRYEDRAADSAGSNELDLTALLAKPVILTSGVILVVLASWQLDGLFTPRSSQMLAHGRDQWALISIFCVFLGVSAIAVWRLMAWFQLLGSSRVEEYRLDPTRCHEPEIPADATEAPKNEVLKTAIRLLALPAMLLLILGVGWLRSVPNSVDSATLSMVLNLLMLAFGVTLLLEFLRAALRWQRLVHSLGPTVYAINKYRQRQKKEPNWPSPEQLREYPQSPFNLHMRECDLQALHEYPRDQWLEYTQSILALEEKDVLEEDAFRRWSRRLIAEMRIASVSVRSLAWGGILAPVLVLLGMSAYPPFDEKLLTTGSVAIVVIGFLLLMYKVIRVETDPLLGKMFTRHSDKLSVGETLGALWGKLTAAALVLVPVLFPDVLDWFKGILQSINSLQ